MLKLERTSQLPGLIVRLRERDPFCEPRLLRAFAIALALHCSAFLLFHIRPFHLPSNFLFPPVQVEADYHVQEVSAIVTAPFEEESFLPSIPLMPALDESFFFQEDPFIPSTNPDLQAFEFLEERLWPKWQPSLPLEQPLIEIAIAGDLAELPLVASDPFLDKRYPFYPTVSFAPLFVLYEVQVDGQTGELIWCECIQSSGSGEIDHLTENILFNLRFAPPPFQEFLTGTLTFTIHSSHILLESLTEQTRY